MLKLLLASDLHLSASEKDYSLSVLDEILALAKGHDALLLLGDTFDNFDNLTELKETFSEKAQSYGKPIYLLKGNHEKLNSNGITLSRLRFPGNVKVIEDKDIFTLESLDIVALGYSETYNMDNDFVQRIESLNAPNRILVAHGTVEGTPIPMEDKEEKAPIPKDMLKTALKAERSNLAIIGHIHKQMELQIDGMEVIYTGSARVSRKSKAECGARRCLSLEISEEEMRKSFVNIKAAGEYRVYELDLHDIDSKLQKAAGEWNKSDIVDINLYGITEDENQLEEKKESIKGEYSKRVREINIKEREILLADNAYGENVIKDFLKIADEYEQNAKSEEDAEIIKLAVRLGIKKMAQALASKKK